MATIFGTSSNNTLIVESDDLRGLAGSDTYIVANNLANDPANANRTIVINDTEGSNRLQLADGLQISRVDFLGGNAVQITLSNNARIQVVGADRFIFDIGGNVVAADSLGLIGRTYAELASAFGVTLSNGSGSTTGPVTVQPGANPLPPPSPPPPAPPPSVLPVVSIAPLTTPAAEGNSGSAAYTFTVSRTGDTTGASTVNYAVTGSGANPVNASDFVGGVLPSGTVSFAAGQTSQVVTVNVAGDTVVEADETFTVSLSAPTGATLGTSTVTRTVVNDDVAPPPPVVSIAPLTTPAAEGNSGSAAYTFTVSRTGNTSGASTVNYAVTGSGANPVNASDFVGGVLPSGTVSFAAGQTSQVVTVNVAGDTVVEADETFTVSLSAPTGATLGTSTVTRTVVNDDSASAGDDFANNASTTGVVAVGGSATGVIEAINDRDWFAVNLVAGQSYRISQTANAGSMLDSFLRVRSGAGVELAANDDSGGGLNSQLVFTANTTGRFYLEAGAYTDGSTGGYSVSVASVPPPPPDDPSRFNITLDYSGPEQYRVYFEQAAARLEQVIVGDLVAGTYNGVQVDDVLISGVLREIDGAGGILGQAGPDTFRPGNQPLPVHGGMQFDVADADALIAGGGFGLVVLHEMLHVLGFGTLWGDYGFNSTFGRYTGARALQEYRAARDASATFVPLETNGGQGSANSHWNDGLFFGEVMGAFYTQGEVAALSRITVGALQDLGYTVNFSAADPFTFNPRLMASQLREEGGEDGILIAQAPPSDVFFL